MVLFTLSQMVRTEPKVLMALLAFLVLQVRMLTFGRSVTMASGTRMKKRQIGRLLVLMVLPELQAQLVRMVSTMFQIHKPVHSSFMAMVIRMHMIQVFLILLLVSLPQLGLRMS